MKNKKKILYSIIFILVLIVSSLIVYSTQIKVVEENDNDIVAHWTFELNNATHVFTNTTRPHYNLTNMSGGAVSIFSGEMLSGLGTAYQFNGTGNLTYKGTDIQDKMGTFFSITGWIKSNSSQVGVGGGIVDVGNGLSSGLAIIKGPGTLVNYYDIQPMTLSNVNDKELVFFAFTKSGNVRKLFANSTNDFISITDTQTYTKGTGNFHVGGYNIIGNYYNFNGTIDELIIWNKTLPLDGNPESILELYNDYNKFSRAIEVNITFNGTDLGTSRTNSSDIITTIVDENTLKIQNNLKGYINIELTATDETAISQLLSTNNSNVLADLSGSATTNITSHIYNNTAQFYDFELIITSGGSSSSGGLSGSSGIIRQEKIELSKIDEQGELIFLPFLDGEILGIDKDWVFFIILTLITSTLFFSNLNIGLIMIVVTGVLAYIRFFL